jgi:hypothetical protein
MLELRAGKPMIGRQRDRFEPGAGQPPVTGSGLPACIRAAKTRMRTLEAVEDHGSGGYPTAQSTSSLKPDPPGTPRGFDQIGFGTHLANLTGPELASPMKATLVPDYPAALSPVARQIESIANGRAEGGIVDLRVRDKLTSHQHPAEPPGYHLARFGGHGIAGLERK